MEITSKINLLVKKSEELTSQVLVAQNTSKFLQEAFNTTSSKLVDPERNYHQFSDIFSIVASKDLENFLLCLLQKIDGTVEEGMHGRDIGKSRIVACHRLGKTDRTTVKFLNKGC